MEETVYREHGIYLDNAATTRMSEGVKSAMDPYLTEQFGNASTVYSYGEAAKNAIETARKPSQHP